jgi:hypothetical protein
VQNGALQAVEEQCQVGKGIGPTGHGRRRYAVY